MNRKAIPVALVFLSAWVAARGQDDSAPGGKGERFSDLFNDWEEFDFGGQAKHTFKRWDVWVPLVAGTVFLAGDFDDEVSERAADVNALFGSRGAAREFSDIGRDTLLVGGLLVSMFKIREDNVSNRTLAFDRRGAVNGSLGLLGTFATTQLLKAATDRERPDADLGGDDPSRSFPSGHTTLAFWGASVMKQRMDNLGYFQDRPKMKAIFDMGAYGFAGAVAWARVEGKRHWPADVLFGAAIGNYFGNFFPVPKKPGRQTEFTVTPYGDGLAIRLHARF